MHVVRLTLCRKSKTTKHHGLDVVELQEDFFPELDRCLSLYLADYRALLLREEIAHAFVFVNAKGEAFKSSAFSEYLGRLLTSHRPKSNVKYFAVKLRDQLDGDESVGQREDECAVTVATLGAEASGGARSAR